MAWTYGDAGNITTRKEYAYTTGTLGSVQSTVNYTYDGTWGDLLTGYNGKTITSDTIGNMLSDGTRTYTWEHDRELSGMTGNAQDSDQEISIDFAYNADGLRTSKTVTTKIYAQTQYTVSFVADSVTVHTLTVDDGYTLTSADYPEVPAKAGYTGSWPTHTSPITSDVTIQAVYTAIPTYTVTFQADGTTVETLTVEDGYVLTDSDYPSGGTGSHGITWERYTSPITSDVTINGTYAWGGITGAASESSDSVEAGGAIIVEENAAVPNR